MKNVFHKEGIAFKLVSSHLHKDNTAEHAIQTFKSHFIACLSGLDQKFSVKQCDRLIPQAELTLNIVYSSILNPKLSA